MYPNLYFLFKDLFGVEIEFFKVIQMFGLIMALSFVVANYVMVKELKRLEGEGRLHTFKKKIVQNKKPTNNDYILNALFYFILGFKLVEAFLYAKDLYGNPQDFLLSTRGNLLGGLVFAAIGYYIVYRQAQKMKGLEQKEEIVDAHPYELMGNVTLIAAVTGLIGAKMFHIFENWGAFLDDPMGNIFSGSGLTFFGGLICGAAGVLWYMGKHGIHWRMTLDAGSSAMMLAYGLGRIGCQVSGDGDWGIVNTSPKPFSFLPDWFWAYDYPHNVGREGVAIPGCTWGDYCNHLPQPVFPTPLYEAIGCILLFFVLWSLRKRISVPGILFSVYLILAGLERFTIEKIRVNNVMDFFGLQMTQAEIISSGLILLGIGGIFYFSRKKMAGLINGSSTGG